MKFRGRVRNWSRKAGPRHPPQDGGNTKTKPSEIGQKRGRGIIKKRRDGIVCGQGLKERKLTSPSLSKVPKTVKTMFSHCGVRLEVLKEKPKLAKTQKYEGEKTGKWSKGHEEKKTE